MSLAPASSRCRGVGESRVSGRGGVLGGALTPKPVAGVCHARRLCTSFASKKSLLCRASSQSSQEEMASSDSQQSQQRGGTWLRNGVDFEVPAVDWSRYYLNVLFVDRDHTTSRLAEGLTQRMLDWRGYARAIYPLSCGTQHAEPMELEQTAGLISVLSPLNISKQTVTTPRRSFEVTDLDAHDLVLALDEEARDDILATVRCADDQTGHYASLAEERVWLLGHFVRYHDWDAILAEKGGSAQLDRRLRELISARKSSTLARDAVTRDIAMPNLKECSKSDYDDVVAHTLMACGGLSSYLVDSSSSMPYESWLEY